MCCSPAARTPALRRSRSSCCSWHADAGSTATGSPRRCPCERGNMWQRARSVGAVVVLAATTMLFGAASAYAKDEPVTMHATVDGQDVSIAADAGPIPLYPDKIA